MRTAMAVRVVRGRAGRLALPLVTAAAICVAAGPAQANGPIGASRLSSSHAVERLPATQHPATRGVLGRRALGRKVG